MNALLQSEPTPIGEQTLVPGVRPIATRERLEARMAAPLIATKPQKPLDLGLFDEAARNQLELFGVSGATSRDTATQLPPGGG